MSCPALKTLIWCQNRRPTDLQNHFFNTCIKSSGNFAICNRMELKPVGCIVPDRLIIRRMMDHVKTKKLIVWVLDSLCRNNKGHSMSDQANHVGGKIVVAN